MHLQIRNIYKDVKTEVKIFREKRLSRSDESQQSSIEGTYLSGIYDSQSWKLDPIKSKSNTQKGWALESGASQSLNLNYVPRKHEFLSLP